MTTELTLQQQLEYYFERVEGCCLHNPVWTPEDVEEVIFWSGDRETGSESSCVVIVRLKAKEGEVLRDYGQLIAGLDDYIIRRMLNGGDIADAYGSDF